VNVEADRSVWSAGTLPDEPLIIIAPQEEYLDPKGLNEQNRLMHGLYDGEFAGFKIASSEQLNTALREAVVAVDANVLLDLYRFRPQTSQDLLKTFKSLAGRRLFLMRPADLLARAAVLEVEVDQASSADAGRVADIEDEPPAEPWTLAALSALLERLDREAPVQAAALRLATPDQGGRVNREKVYELGDYADDRMLRGFTRPFRRLTAVLQEEGKVPAGVSPIFVARYPDGVKTSYFSVPSEVPQLLEELTLAVTNTHGEASAG
jgi:PIN domain-containing protein